MKKKQMLYPKIVVITITKNRPSLLKRAILSIKEQTYPNILHYIVIDDCIKTLEMLKREYTNDSRVCWEYARRDDEDKDGPSVLAKLRTNAIHSIKAKWFSFLDDDNEFYPEHLEKLYKFASKRGCDAVHSYRKVFNNDGSPYLKAEWPWGRTKEEKLCLYKEMFAAGIVQKDSNIFCDRYGVTIDTNLWLLRTKLFDGIEITRKYTKKDFEECRPEDEKMMDLLIKNKIMVLSNNESTVKYYLGGYSNLAEEPTEGTVLWQA